MARSLKLREECKALVKDALQRHESGSQEALALQLQVVQSTMSRFFNGRPVERRFFKMACIALGLDWQGIAEFDRPSKTEVKTKVFISYCSVQPDQTVAQAFAQAIRSAGNEVLMLHEDVVSNGILHVEVVQTAIKESDYFLLLLSSEAAASETVALEVKLAKQARDAKSQDVRPIIHPVLLNFSFEEIPSYDLQHCLQPLTQWKWRDHKDTDTLVKEFLLLLAEGQIPKPLPLNLATPSQDFQEMNSSLTSPANSLATSAVPLEIPRGPVRLSSVFYVDRPPIESDCNHAIQQPAALIRIKAPHQTGKTSLLLRILDNVKTQGRTVNINFKHAPQSCFENPEQFLRWFCNRVSYELGVPSQLSNFWDSTYDSNLNCEEYFEKYLLPQVSAPVFLGLDEIDFLFEYPAIYPDFFGLLRSMNEAVNRRDVWGHLRQIIVHSTEAYVPMNPHQSPFENVGFSVELPDLTRSQVKFLADQHHLGWEEPQVRQLMVLVGGHPRLVRLAMYHVVRGDVSLSQLLQPEDLGTSIYGDHLRTYEVILDQYPDLANAMKKVVSADSPVWLSTVPKYKLQGIGLVRLQANGVVPRCKLYLQYFRGLHQSS